ncbi:DUF4865 family protein [Catenulispora subtropica]|uniref:DUF4865 family protein n=1 Tax=Catenulispora subtropica TaxID=450798 RepID=A0ABP5BWJ0_9ACTN
MYAMQYEISVPADYDMAILRDRVAKAAPMLDDRAGLGLKAYVIRELADGSPVNQYAPFYLWNDTAAMSRFLFAGAGFERIIRSFGRVTVRQWTGLARFAGPAMAGNAAAAASRRTRPVPVFDDTLSTWIEEIAAEAEDLAGRDDAHTVALAIDPTRWELVEFALWADAVPADVAATATERYQVLHISRPELAALPKGLLR